MNKSVGEWKNHASLCDFSKLMKSKNPPRSIRGIERLETDDLACSKFRLRRELTENFSRFFQGAGI